MLTFFTALCPKVANPPSLKLFASVIIDDALTVSADLRRTNVGDMKKINNHINPFNTQCACSPSLQLYARKWRIPPLWSCLSQWLLMMRWLSVLICVELMLEIWKKSTITSIRWKFSVHAYHLCNFMPERGESSLFEAVCLSDYWWCANCQCWFA